MPVIFKIDVLEAMKAAGYSTYRIRKDKLIGESQLQRLREGDPVSLELLAKVCALTSLQPGDLLEYLPDDTTTTE